MSSTLPLDGPTEGLPRPYYQDQSVTLYHGDCREFLPTLGDNSADLVLTDPPYSSETHKNAKTNADGQRGGRLIRASFDAQPPRGLRFLRFGVWVKPDGMPQVSGDRPAQGWEAIAFMHKGDGRPRWNGGGRSSAFVHGVDRNGYHPTGKPAALVGEWVRLFSDPGDVVLDPFAGSGTTLRAAKDNGRYAIGVEMDERYCEIAAKRLSQDVLDFGGVA